MEIVESEVGVGRALEPSCATEGGEAALQPKSKLRRFAERGMTTVEYAIGLLAAATLALVLLRVFKDNEFFAMLMDWVVDVFAKVAELA